MTTGNKMFKNALVSVSDKNGLADFLKPHVENGLRILSTGGTAKYLKENGIPIVDVSDQTGFPEVMDGRVKTLHPKIHMALLSRDHVEMDQKILEENGIEAIDLVIGNLYPFEGALKKNLSDREISEFIDIGGPSFLRAAAKSYERISVICDPDDYQWINEKKELSLNDRRQLAAKIFAHTSSYDAMIANELSGKDLKTFCLGGSFVSELRYGENPQQKSVWYRARGSRGGLHEAKILQGKALSYNNLLDLEAACSTLSDFTEKCTVAVKHNNPCGVGLGDTAEETVKNALGADPVSVFGGIVATNSEVDEKMAEHLTGLFLECVIAPKVNAKAQEVLAKKKNLRVLEWPDILEQTKSHQVKTISGGYLVQAADTVSAWSEDWKIIGGQPDEEYKKALSLAWRVCANLKSNAIAIASSCHSLGLGMGQVNRVDAVEQSIARMKHHHGDEEVKVLASDAFFPFPDSIELIAEAGIQWVIQPGGSIKDEQVFAKAKELGVNLILTGTRHFKH